MADLLPFPRSSHVGRSSLGTLFAGEQPQWVILYEECQPDYRIERPQGFPLPSMEIIVDGEGSVTRDGRTLALRPGSHFSYGPGRGIRFTSSAHKPLRKFFLAALKTEWWKAQSFARLDPDTVGTVDHLELVEQLLHEVLVTTHRSFPAAPTVVRALLESVGALLLRSEQVSTEPRRQHALVGRALRHLETNLLATSTVNEWAEALGVSPTHLCRVFRRHHPKTPYAELTDRKLHAAYHLLATGAGNVRTVAERVGFDDPFHFSRVFRKRIGIAPSSLLP